MLTGGDIQMLPAVIQKKLHSQVVTEVWDFSCSTNMTWSIQFGEKGHPGVMQINLTLQFEQNR